MKYSIPVSVIMPVRQGERFVGEAIDSILNQSFNEFELIVLDDGSTDKTWDIINSYNDRRLKSLKVSFSNNYKARNFGMSKSLGKYICMMDSDDLSFPNRLKKQYFYLEEHHETSVIGSQMEFIDKNSMPIKSNERRATDYSEIKVFQLMNVHIPQPTLMFDGDIFRKYGHWYDSSYKYAGDYEYMVRLSQEFKIENLDETLVKYRKHSGQISHSQFSEQGMFADKVRLKQLDFFGLSIDKEEIAIHLKLMKGHYLDDKELRSAEKWLNRLLEANIKMKIFNHEYLYKFFELILALALRNQEIKNKMPSE